MPRGSADGDVYGEPSEVRARRRRAAVTFLVVVLLLFFAAWYAMSYIRADDERRANRPTASPTRSCALTPKDVRVNVYNATTRDGLAGRVAGELEKRGFEIGAVANDPWNRPVSGVAELRYGPKGSAAATLVAAHVDEAKERKDERSWSTVDIVLGPKFSSLVPADLAKKRGC